MFVTPETLTLAASIIAVIRPVSVNANDRYG